MKKIIFPRFLLAMLLLGLANVVLLVNGNAVLYAEETAVSPLWRDVAEENIDALDADRWIVPRQYRLLALDTTQLRQQLAQAPLESAAPAVSSAFILSLPMPDGGNGRFRIVESPIMAPELAAKFPQIKTYAGQGIDDPTATTRLDWTPAGFHAIILSANGTVYIDPYARGNTIHYISYHKQEAINRSPFDEIAPEELEGIHAQEMDELVKAGLMPAVGEQLRTYRLAVAATGEYTVFHGGTVVAGQAAIVTTINRVTGIYEREIAVRFELIANNDTIVYTNAGSDPYTNGNAGAMINENQSNLDSVIGNANYDVGHVFGTNSGGLASLGVICSAGSKARGITGSSAPIGDPFDVDYVAHELGHQFGGNHTFNGSSGSCSGGNRNGSTAYEPGSGSTIQAYAGICSPQDLQSNSDDYFHTISFDEMVAHTTAGSGSTCGVVTATGNTAPVANATTSGANGVTIPINTPFELTGSGTDGDGDPLTYNWEEFDLGPAGHPNSPLNNAPIFRSFLATTSPTRTFPKLSDIVDNTQTIGEILPSYTRDLTFRLTVRDNRSGGGGVDHDQIAFNVTDQAGPFLVTTPNTAVTWVGGSSETVTWDVANTTAAPVSCSQVNIALSTDGGYTYPTTLVAGTTNDGSESVIVPNTPNTTARVRVECANNIFFDISNANFTIIAGGDDFTVDAAPETQMICVGNSAVYNVAVGEIGTFNHDITLSAPTAPGTPSFTPNGNQPPYSSTLTINGAALGSYTFDVVGDGGGNTHTDNIALTVATTPIVPTLTSPANGAAGVAISLTFNWTAVPAAAGYDIEIATDAGFSNIVDSASVATNSYNAAGLNPFTTYYWHVRATNNCGLSPYAGAFSFTTENIICSTPNVAIPDNDPAGVSDTMAVGAMGTITDLNVSAIATHTWVGDLIFTLEHVDTGTSVTIIDRPGVPASTYGCGDDNVDVLMDDEGTSGAVEAACPISTGLDYTPNNPLSAFDGEDLSGDWKLTVSDNEGQDTGTLNEWCLVPTVSVCAMPTAVSTYAISANGTQAVLTWTDTDADQYQVHSSLDPYFMPDGSTTVGAPVAPGVQSFTDAAGTIGNPAMNYFYAIVAENTCGTDAPPVKHVGEFDFAITPGS